MKFSFPCRRRRQETCPHISMNQKRKALYGLAIVLVTVGCGWLVSGGRPGLATICFSAPAFLLISPQEVNRPVQRRMFWSMVGMLILWIGGIMLLRRMIPDDRGERFLSHPAVVACLWVLMVGAVWLRWRKEKSTLQGL